MAANIKSIIGHFKVLLKIDIPGVEISQEKNGKVDEEHIQDINSFFDESRFIDIINKLVMLLYDA